eukprot:GDKJ01042218.1.p1 GENE.GDKJ01042218.1~~GDKJ01042218.1.p1  ORF type:complete len:167 (-),score=5.37 GDKJ01042218.1:206-706(-)
MKLASLYLLAVLVASIAPHAVYGMNVPPPQATALDFTNTTFIASVNSDTVLVSALQDYLQEPQGDFSKGAIYASCDGKADVTGNYTCLVSFSNSTQATEAVRGANSGKITYVYSAYFGAPTAAPTVAPRSNRAAAMGILIGTMACLMIFLALISIIAVGATRARKV